MLDIAIVTAAGFLAALVGSMSGGGAGIIQLAALLYIGLPVNSAVATHIFGDAGFYPPALRNLRRAKQFKKRALPPIVVLNLLATAAGTFLIIRVSEDLLTKLIIASLVIVLLFVIRKKEAPVTERRPKRAWPWVYSAARFAAAGGFGNNLLAVSALIYFRGLTALQAVAAALLANGLSSLLAIGMLLFSGLIDFRFGIALLLANMIGAQIGSRLAVKGGNNFVRRAMAAMATAMIICLLVFNA